MNNACSNIRRLLLIGSHLALKRRISLRMPLHADTLNLTGKRCVPLQYRLRYVCRMLLERINLTLKRRISLRMTFHADTLNLTGKRCVPLQYRLRYVCRLLLESINLTLKRRISLRMTFFTDQFEQLFKLHAFLFQSLHLPLECGVAFSMTLSAHQLNLLSERCIAHLDAFRDVSSLLSNRIHLTQECGVAFSVALGADQFNRSGY